MEQHTRDIWTDLYQELRKFILHKVNDATASDDIVQEVFLKVHTHLHQLKDPSKLTAWTYQVTRNTIADHYRKKRSHEDIDAVDLAADASDEPLYAALSDCINSKINLLPDKYREAVLLTSFQHYSQLELAGYLGISYSGAKTRVQRAKDQLKDLVTGCSNVETDRQGNIIAYNGPET